MRDITALVISDDTAFSTGFLNDTAAYFVPLITENESTIERALETKRRFSKP